jgi:hypothetical protein
VATPLRLGSESEHRQARDALEERLADLDATEARLAALERTIAGALKHWNELQVDVAQARLTLLSGKEGTQELNQTLHQLGVRAHKLDALLAHPGRRLRILQHAAGLAGTGGGAAAGAVPGGPQALVSARWGEAAAAPGAQVPMEVIADGYADGTPVSFRVLVRGTDRLAATVAADVHRGRAAALWSAGLPDEYEFVVEVGSSLSRSGPLRVK